jgi:aminoglycoside 3-N-acetyltransferase
MSEWDAVGAADCPATIESLVRDFQALGLKPGMTVIVHSSLSALGWVCGGPVTVILALEAALGPDGTLVMPTHSGDLSDPAEWGNPPVPEAWWEIIRETMPAYDPDLTPTRGMGAIPETFRKQPGVIRSAHPQVSFAAYGAQAQYIAGHHPLAYSLGDDSPLARIYDLDGSVLLLGVGHANNTSLHLAEYRAAWAGKRVLQRGAPVLIDGERRWETFDDVNTDPDDFERLGAAFNAHGPLRTGRIAQARALLFPQRAVVDFGMAWLAANRV